jgi:hypothetical protein
MGTSETMAVSALDPESTKIYCVATCLRNINHKFRIAIFGYRDRLLKGCLNISVSVRIANQMSVGKIDNAPWPRAIIVLRCIYTYHQARSL